MTDLFPIQSNGPIDPKSSSIARADCSNDIRFELTVPQHLKRRPSESLLTLASPGPDGLNVHVSVRPMVRELHPADWLLAELEASGARILHKRVLAAPRLRELDVLYTSADSLTSRKRTLADGGRLFEITAAAPSARFPEVAQEAFVALASFRLLDPAAEAHAEKCGSWKAERPLPIEFEHPESWQVAPVVQNDGLLALEITSEYQQSPTGRIRIEVRQPVPGGGAVSILQSFADSLKDAGMHLNGAPVVAAPPLHGFQRAWFYTPRAAFQGRAFDSPVLLLKSPAATVVLGLLGTAKEHSPHWWAVNKRAFEIVRDSLNVGSQ